MSFKAPTVDILFILKHEVGFDRLKPLWPELDDTLIAAILDEAARLTESVIAPCAREGDMLGAQFENGEVRVPPSFREAYQHYIDGGWSSIAAPQKYGGQGLPSTLANVVADMMNVNIGFQLCPMLSYGAIEALSAHASETQKELYLRKMISGVWSGTMNLTEPQAGSDVGAVATRAIPQPDGSYKIRGTKIYITHGEHDMVENIIHLVLARTPDAPDGTRGLSLFLVPKYLVSEDGSPGARNDVACIGLEEKLGIHASPTCVMAYGENDGAIGWLVGAEHKGMAAMFTMMNNARLNVGLQGVGIAEAATQLATEFAHIRIQGHRKDQAERTTINAHPDVRRMLMTMRTLTNVARAICYENGVMFDLAHKGSNADAKARNDLLTPISKAFSTDIANEVAALGVQVHGGMGFIEETGAAQHIRDARILTIYEGTNGIQAIDLVTRKLPLENGGVIRAYIDEISETVRAARQSNHPMLADVVPHFDVALASLLEATDWLLARHADGTPTDIDDMLAGATPYLRLIGLVAGMHYLTRGALADAGDSAVDGTSRVAHARFYANNILSACDGLARSAMAGVQMLG